MPFYQRGVGKVLWEFLTRLEDFRHILGWKSIVRDHQPLHEAAGIGAAVAEGA